MSSSCVPTSATRAPSRTTMRSAMRTVEKPCDAFGPGGAELRLQARCQPNDDVVGAGAADGRHDRGLVVQPRHVADAHGVAGAELETEEVLEGAGQPRAPQVGGHAGELDAV